MQEVQEDPETLLKLWFISEGKSSRKALVEKVGNRGHDVFSHLRSLGSQCHREVSGSNPCCHYIPADPDTGKHFQSLTRPSLTEIQILPFLSTLQMPNSHCQQRGEAAGMLPWQEAAGEGQEQVGPGDAPFSQGRQGGKEGGRTVPAWAACALSWLPDRAAQPDSCVAF